MAKVDMIQGSTDADTPKANFIVIPGIAGTNLDLSTCPHFRPWLDRLVAEWKCLAQSWFYNHSLEIDQMESWDVYSSTGDDFLNQLIAMQKDHIFGDRDSLILIGHKMGCYILKQALAEAHLRDKPEQRELLNKVDTIMMVGEPYLHADNKWEWFDLICLSLERPLPTKLADNLSVGVLQRIAESFEAALLWSTMFEVSGVPRKKPKFRWKLQRCKSSGCICAAKVQVRLGTTASEDMNVEMGPGDFKACSFHPNSGHYKNLLLLDSAPNLAHLQISNSSSTETNHFGTSPDLLRNESHDQVNLAILHQSRDIDCPGATNTSLEVISEPIPPSSLRPELNSLQEREDDQLSSNSDAIASWGNIETIIEKPSKSSKSTVDENASPPKRKRNPIFSSTIPPRDSLFYGREMILKILKETIKNISSASESNCLYLNKPQILCLTGVGGVGKTAIALEHLYRSTDRVDDLFWINASSPANLGKHVHDFAVALDLVQGRLSQDHQESRVKLLEWLENSGRTFLLVFDDVRRHSDVTMYMPKTGRGSILLTSRHEPDDSLIPHAPAILHLPPPDEIEAARFLFINLFRGKDKTQAKELCIAASRYHASPIILRHLVNWSVRHSIPIQQINRFLDAKESSLRLQVRLHRGSFDDLMAIRTNDLNTRESSVFNTLCFFDPEGVQQKFLLIRDGETELPLQNFPRDELKLQTSLKHLWCSSLVEIKEENTVHCVHQTVQEFMRARMDSQTFNDSFSTASTICKLQWPPKRKFQNIVRGFWPQFDSIHSQVQSLVHSLRTTRHIVSDANDDFKQLLIHHSWYNSRRGNHAEDLDLAQLAFSLFTTSSANLARESLNTALPRRCIKLGFDCDTLNPHLVDTSQIHGSYCALSYCWSSQERTSSWQLTSKTLDQYKRGINLEALPLRLRDAMALTRNLGCEYLWIDSICIVQDSPEDIAEEALWMPFYYANCVAIIAELQVSQSIQTSLDFNEDIVDVAQYSLYKMPRISIELNKGTIRGWAYQESLLPPFSRAFTMNSLEGACQKCNGIKMTTSECLCKFFRVKFCSSDVRCLPNQNEDISSHQVRESQVTETQTSAMTDAKQAFDEGRRAILENSFVEAAASLNLSRDILSPMQSHWDDAKLLHALATAMLGTSYHLMNLSRLALRILRTENHLYLQNMPTEGTGAYEKGRIFLAIGICLLHLGKAEEAEENLEFARKLLLGSDRITNDLSAAIYIKLSDCALVAGNITETRALLQSALDCVHGETSESGQRHLPRILHRQSLIYKTEKNKIMCSAFAAAACDAMAEITANSETFKAQTSTMTLEESMFDDLVEPWFR